MSIHDTPGQPVQALSVPPLSLGLLFTPQSLRTFYLTLAPLARCTRRVDPCAPRAHLAVMVTPRTQCHFMTQARALRVPELCDDHTPPSCLVTNSLAEPMKSSVDTLVLPDPLLTQGGLVAFLRVCIALAFRQVVRLGASWSVLFTCLCLYTPQLRAASALLCPSSLSLRAHMDELQNMRLPLGTTEWNHSYYTGNSLSALHSLQQLQAGASSPPSVQMSASTRESHDAATSSSVSCPQVTHSAISPQVQTGPTRTVTSDLLPATLAEVATQLSFAAFLERCISVSASPPPLPIPTPPLDAATQTIPHIAVSQDVSTQLSPKEFLAPPSTHDVLCPTCSRTRPFVTA